MVKLVLVSAALLFSLVLMPGSHSRGSVWPDSLCDAPGRCVLWLESSGSHTEPRRVWDLLCPFSTMLGAGRLGRRPPKITPETTGGRIRTLMAHTPQTFLKMNHCRGWDVSRAVLNQELSEQFWFPRWVCLNLCRWLLFQQAYQAFRCIFFPVEENIQGSRDSGAG